MMKRIRLSETLILKLLARREQRRCNFFIFLFLFINKIVFAQINILKNDSFFILKDNLYNEGISFDINLKIKLKDGKYKAIRNGSIIEGTILNGVKVDTWRVYNKKNNVRIIQIFNQDSNVEYYYKKNIKYWNVSYNNKNERFEKYYYNNLIHCENYIDSLNLFVIKEFYSNGKLKKSYNIRNNSKYGNYLECYPNGNKKMEACYCELNFITIPNEINIDKNELCRKHLCIYQDIKKLKELNDTNNVKMSVLKEMIFNLWDKKGNPIIKWEKVGYKFLRLIYKKGKIVKRTFYSIPPIEVE